jgi:hypothetical protein
MLSWCRSPAYYASSLVLQRAQYCFIFRKCIPHALGKPFEALSLLSEIYSSLAFKIFFVAFHRHYPNGI